MAAISDLFEPGQFGNTDTLILDATLIPGPRPGDHLTRMKDWQMLRQCKRHGNTINLATRCVAYL